MNSKYSDAMFPPTLVLFCRRAKGFLPKKINLVRAKGRPLDGRGHGAKVQAVFAFSWAPHQSRGGKRGVQLGLCVRLTPRGATAQNGSLFAAPISSYIGTANLRHTPLQSPRPGGETKNGSTVTMRVQRMWI